MTGFTLTTDTGITIRFRYYLQDAPITSQAFAALLPFSRTFMHARTSGLEIWTDNAPELDIIQENASICTIPGEVVYGPLKPARVATSNCMGIYYGTGKGLDSCNIFARVYDEDAEHLSILGNTIWKGGEQTITFTHIN
jgi:hypothetical protein